MSSKQGALVAEKLSDLVNSTSINNREDFVSTVLGDHRTLQQETFNLFIETMRSWAKLENTDFYDERNKYAVETSAKIIRLIEGK